MEKETFEKLFAQKQEQVEDILKRYLPAKEGFQKTIFDAMSYSLLAGGKRLRPILLGEAYALFGGTDQELAEPFMAAIEMIHTYSLVHDDLPAMDNDEYRRGRKTTHVVYGEDMGILAGDALLNFAYETASSAFSRIYPERGQAPSGYRYAQLEGATRAFQIIAKKAGVFGMVGGQVVDVEQTGKAMTEEVLEFIYHLKTGALLEASLMAGAALAGADEASVDVLEQVGRDVGMAFQIQDDILDVTSTAEELGKPIHSDEKNHKNTYVALHGMEEAQRAVKEYSEKAIRLLDSLEGENVFLNELLERLIYRKK